MEHERAGGRGEIGGVVVVLHHDRDAVHGGSRALAFALGVELTGALERVRIDGNDGVELGTGLVVGLDASEAEFDEPLRCQSTGVEGSVDFSDGSRRQLERFGSGEGGDRENGGESVNHKTGSYHRERILWHGSLSVPECEYQLYFASCRAPNACQNPQLSLGEVTHSAARRSRFVRTNT